MRQVDNACSWPSVKFPSKPYLCLTCSSAAKQGSAAKRQGYNARMNRDCPIGHCHCAAEHHLVPQETPRCSKHLHVSSSSYNSAPLTISSLLIRSRFQVPKVFVIFSKASPQPLLFICLSCPLSKGLNSLNFIVHKHSNTAVSTQKSRTT